MNDLSSRFTPIDDSDPNCERTEATLCIYNIDPDLVTNKLGIKPTGGLKKDAVNILPSGNKKIGRVNSWLISSEEFVSSKDIRTHLDWLLDLIEPVIKEIKELQQFPGVKMAVRCVWWSVEEDWGGFSL
jgi:hypothetical protein